MEAQKYAFTFKMYLSRTTSVGASRCQKRPRTVTGFFSPVPRNRQPAAYMAVSMTENYKLDMETAPQKALGPPVCPNEPRQRRHDYSRGWSERQANGTHGRPPPTSASRASGGTKITVGEAKRNPREAPCSSRSAREGRPQAPLPRRKIPKSG